MSMSTIEAMESLEAAAIAGKGVMAILDQTGDTKLIWDRNNEDEVENAKETFKRLTKKGHTAYLVKKDGEKGKVMTEFDPDAQAIVMAPRMVGG